MPRSQPTSSFYLLSPNLGIFYQNCKDYNFLEVLDDQTFIKIALRSWSQQGRWVRIN